MNDTAVQNLDIDEDISASQPGSPGAYLSSLRQEQGLSQSQVAESLHLTVHYVNALENDEYHKLPGKIFAKGYLKSYALLLSVAADPVIGSFESLCRERNDFPQDLGTIQSQVKTNRYGLIWFVLAGLLLLMVAAASWFFWSGSQQTTPQVQQGLVPDYLRAADNNKQEVTVSIPVGNQFYTVSGSATVMPGNSNADSDKQEKTVSPNTDQQVKPDSSDDEGQRLTPASAASRLEG